MLQKKVLFIALFALAFFVLNSCGDDDPLVKMEVESVTSSKLFFNDSLHLAFTDIVYYDEKWRVAFRASDKHVYGQNGKIKVYSSLDKSNWILEKTFENDLYDLRDPDFYFFNNELFLKLHGTLYSDREILDYTEFLVPYSTQGGWGEVSAVNENLEYWLWKFSEIDNRLLSIGYRTNFETAPVTANLKLFEITNGNAVAVCDIDLPGHYNEGVIKKMNGKNIAIVRNEWGNLFLGEIDLNNCEFIDYEFPLKITGGPEFVWLGNNEILIIGRFIQSGLISVVAVTYNIEEKSIVAYQFLESGGDCGYPGIQKDGDSFILSYYSSHEGTASIYINSINR